MKNIPVFIKEAFDPGEVARFEGTYKGLDVFAASVPGTCMGVYVFICNDHEIVDEFGGLRGASFLIELKSSKIKL